MNNAAFRTIATTMIDRLEVRHCFIKFLLFWLKTKASPKILLLPLKNVFFCLDPDPDCRKIPGSGSVKKESGSATLPLSICCFKCALQLIVPMLANTYLRSYYAASYPDPALELDMDPESGANAYILIYRAITECFEDWTLAIFNTVGRYRTN